MLCVYIALTDSCDWLWQMRYFECCSSLPHVQCPTLMLHAEDDRTIPLDLAQKVCHVLKFVSSLMLDVQVCKCMCVCMCACVCVLVCLCVCVFAFTFVCALTSGCVCICLCVCVCLESDSYTPVDLLQWCQHFLSLLQLFHSVMSARKPDQPRVTMHVFPADKGYGHNHLSQAPDLGSVVR